MRKIVYKTDTYGNVNRQKSLTGLVNLLNQMVEEDPKGRNKAKYITKLIQSYNETLYTLGSARGHITTIKPKLLEYVFNDYSKRVMAQELPIDLKTHIICFLSGLYKSKLKDAKDSKR